MLRQHMGMQMLSLDVVNSAIINHQSQIRQLLYRRQPQRLVGLRIGRYMHKLQVQQMDDPHLSIVINWLTSDSVRFEFPRQEGFVVQSLWNQCDDSLCLVRNVLHRKWEDVPNGGLDPRLQLVVPTKLVPRISTITPPVVILV